jgi:hypothetical protein
MSNYMRLLFCKRCYAMTNHWFMDGTPSEGLFTVECCKCGNRPIQGEECKNSALWTDAAIEENKLKEVSENVD